MVASAGASLNTFSADVLTLTSNSLPFSDNFSAATNQQLSNSWLNQRGSFQINTATQTATGLGSFNLATVNGVKVADATVQATINVTGTGELAALVLRSSGPLEQNEYFAQFQNVNGTYQASIWRNLNGNWTQVGSTQVVSGTGTGTLKFVARGSSLRLYINGILIVSGIDTALTSGTVGMGGSAGVVLSAFSATSP
jgi:hypothetical protein